MGTHPIFESDFDCLTEYNFKMPLSLFIGAGGVSLAPLISMFVIFIAPSHVRIIFWICGAFFWLLSLLGTAILWNIWYACTKSNDRRFYSGSRPRTWFIRSAQSDQFNGDKRSTKPRKPGNERFVGLFRRRIGLWLTCNAVSHDERLGRFIWSRFAWTARWFKSEFVFYKRLSRLSLDTEPRRLVGD